MFWLSPKLYAQIRPRVAACKSLWELPYIQVCSILESKPFLSLEFVESLSLKDFFLTQASFHLAHCDTVIRRDLLLLSSKGIFYSALNSPAHLLWLASAIVLQWFKSFSSTLSGPSLISFFSNLVSCTRQKTFFPNHPSAHPYRLRQS